MQSWGGGSLASSPEQFSKLEEIQLCLRCPLLNSGRLGCMRWEPRRLGPGLKKGGMGALDSWLPERHWGLRWGLPEGVRVQTGKGLLLAVNQPPVQLPW